MSGRAKSDAGPALSDAGACMDGKFCPPTNPDQGCGTLSLATSVKRVTMPGNVLVLFDQSASMIEPWGTTTKIDAAATALVSAFTPLQDQLTIGALFFPSVLCAGITLQGGAVAPIDGNGQIPFVPGPQFLQQFNDHVAAMGALGVGTPLNEAFDRADVAISNARGAMPPQLTGKLVVVLFTDGDPTCFPDQALTGIPTKPEVDWAAQWQANGITTHVVGLPGAMGATLLPQIAQSGGSMDIISPDTPMDLETKLRSIVEQIVTMGIDSCEIDLTPPTSAPEKLQLVVEEQGMAGLEDVPHDLGGAAGGWTIDAAGAHVQLQGAFCDSAKAGKFSKLTFEFGCKDIPPFPPSHVM
jgi:hypothetical protein